MNCRRVNSLLSAYLDSELTGAEMLAIREHLSFCDSCQDEYEGLSETKRLVASLAFRAPRADLEDLLLRDAERASRGFGPGAIAGRVLEWFIPSRDTAHSPAAQPPLYLRPRPMVATLLLSVAGIWLASASVDVPADNASLTQSGVAGEAMDSPVVPTVSTMMPVSVVMINSSGVASSGGTWMAVSTQSVPVAVVPAASGTAGSMTLAGMPAAMPIGTVPVTYGGGSGAQSLPQSSSLPAPVSLSGIGFGGDAAGMISSMRRHWAMYGPVSLSAR